MLVRRRQTLTPTEMLRTVNDNPTCRHVIFAGCHDGGYLPNLGQTKHNTAKASQITLLETTPMLKGFGDMPNFRRTRFDDVFRVEPLPDALPVSVLAVRAPAQARVATNQEIPAAQTLRSTDAVPSRSTTPSVVSAGAAESNGDSWGKCFP